MAINFETQCFCGLCLFLLCFCSGCRDYTEAEIDQWIDRSSTLQKADSLCKEIPIPRGLTFVGRKIGGNSSKSGIGYIFKTDRPVGDVRDDYMQMLFGDGWERDEEGSDHFRKGKFRLSVDRAEYTSGVEGVVLTCSFLKN